MAAHIGVVADLHFTEDREEEGRKRLTSIVERFDDRGVDHVFVMGDMIGGGGVGTYDDSGVPARRLLQTIQDIMDEGGFPATYLLGNHEVTALSRDEVLDVLSQERYGTRTVAGEDIIFLDSSAPRLSGSRGELGKEQRAFLGERLEETSAPLVFVHHPLHYHNVEDSPWWDTYPERAFCGDKKEVNTNILGEHGPVRAVFNAHLHEHDRTVYEGVPHFTIEPFARKTPGAGVSGAFGEITVDEDEIAVEIRNGDDTLAEYTHPS